MGSLGVYLRELRSAKDVSLDEVTRATRVGRAHLEALEVEDLPSLPAPVFVKGFIRAYCEFLQTDPAEALSRYRDLIGERTHASPGPLEPRAAGVGRGPVFVSVILLLVLGGALFALNSGRSGSSHTTPPSPLPGPTAPEPVSSAPATAPPPANAAPVAEPAATPAATAPTPVSTRVAAAPAAAPAPTEARSAGQRLVVKATEPTWLRVQMDGTRSVEELLPAGATREWSAEKRFILTVGNAGGISLELNGRALPPIGAPGAVIRELVLPADGG
jgi:cytoskeletal protein RodZ